MDETLAMQPPPGRDPLRPWTSTPANQRVERCIESAVQRWTFPPPDGGGIVIINYPLALSTD